MADYRYADWLKTHAKKKTIMEKLERSLVPFQLFSTIEFESLSEGTSSVIEYNGNSYSCQLLSRGVVNEREVSLFRLNKVNMTNVWEDVLMGYSDFKVVRHEGKIVTIYPYQEQYFNQIIGMFDAEQYFDLYKIKTLYIKNLLARYILLKLVNTHKSYMSLLYSVRHQGEIIPVLAGVESKEWILYAFTRKEANELARHYKDACRKLTVVYFINHNFEYEDRNRNFTAPNLRVISIKQFYRELNVSSSERKEIEKQIFFLIEMLYEKRMEWDAEKLRYRILHAPKLTDKNPHWMEVPKMLVEDALNVLVEDYNNPKDIFHMLCAANLINTYTNRYKDKSKMALKAKKQHTKTGRSEKVILNKRVHIMYCFKNQVMETIVKLLKNKSRHLKVSLAHVFGASEYTLLVNVRMEGQEYQFKFRGIHPKYIEELRKLGVHDNGQYNMIRLQPIAPALYLYSYHLKWNR